VFVFSFMGGRFCGLSTDFLGSDLGLWIVGGVCLGWGVFTESLLEIDEPSFVGQVDDALGSLVDGLAQTERMAARVAAWRVEQVDAIRRFAEVNIPVTTSAGMRPWSRAATARRTAVSEVAAALRIPERSAETLIEEARMLTERLPLTMAGLESGDFSFRHAKSIVAHASSLPEDLYGTFEAAVVPSASRLTFSKFDRKARTMRERMDAATITERHQRSLADRETFFEPARDGMGWLHLYTSAHIGLAAYNRADEMAHELQGPEEDRTLTQLRADVVSDLLLDGVVGDRPEFGIRPSVVVTVPALAMLGHGAGKKPGKARQGRMISRYWRVTDPSTWRPRRNWPGRRNHG
jgi:hypothetical protein